MHATRDSEEATGRLRFAASSTFAQLYVAPILPEFLERYPSVSLELRLSDTQTNLIEGGFDLALRNYPIEDSNLKARKLADDKRVLCASPDYLNRHGVPRTPRDLQSHRLVAFQGGTPRALSKNGMRTPHTFPPAGAKPRVTCDDGASMRVAAVAGTGITTVFTNLEGFPEDWRTNPDAFIRFVRDHQCPSFLEYGEYPYVTADEIKKALRLKSAFSDMLDQMQ